ncbi:TPA: hypothetical protein NZK24_005512 [Klebsiella pneumoniae]|jgi:3-deoxy-D-arabino-heptulosonate 7-phosphate (DAHP) synthase|uniref:hypothetical protein n=1 Tax=Citrobacter sp. RHBSTW-00029 TaxID=2742631 RepID=UPI0015F8169E|nr:hypothetical protein [Citrobacter sp. RHBSTW-00029]MBA8109244.1 hypothetical protein [Citrobacter sp. RHBSTW-00029]HCK3387630.1 hypothetical protein [Klebsiella pneumoniae]
MDKKQKQRIEKRIRNIENSCENIFYKYCGRCEAKKRHYEYIGSLTVRDFSNDLYDDPKDFWENEEDRVFVMCAKCKYKNFYDVEEYIKKLKTLKDEA